MRSLWKGAISFGLVHIPVSLYAATERKDVRFNFLHKECNTPIQYRKVCPNCQKEVSPEEIVRGYEYEKGRYVIISDDDFEGIAIEATKTVDIVDFVDISEVDPVYYDKTYYLEPTDTGGKAYQLLKVAMQDTGKVAVAKVMIRSRQVLALVRVYQNLLVLETMFFPDEIRAESRLNTGVEAKIHDNELKMAISLINSLVEDFAPEKYRDNYREALLDIIDKKIAGEEVARVDVRPRAGKVVDLMAALEASLKAAEEQKKVTVSK